MSKIPKRQKVQPRMYTQRELDDAARRACAAAAKHNVYLTLGAMCIALHEMHGFSKGRLNPLLDRITDIEFMTLARSELLERVKNETGVNLIEFEEERRELV